MSYCLKCGKNAKSKNPKFVKTKNEIIMVISNCVVYGTKKIRFIKEQEASGLLSSLRIRTPFNQIPLVGPLLF